jgi:opacity protein-like surface antigen
VQRAILSLTLLPLLMASAGPASAGGLDVRLGAFIPRANNCGIPSSDSGTRYTLFADVCELYLPLTYSLDSGLDWSREWVGFAWGVEYNHVVVDNLEVGVHVDGYTRTIDTSYRDYERPDGTEIFQTLKLDIVPFGLTVRLVPTSKRAKVAPYVGGGVDLVYYKYEEWGDFIDFWDPDLLIYSDNFISDGVTFGFHAVGGLRFYLNRDFALIAEGRYQWADTNMSGDFSPTEPGLINHIDLTGFSVTGGLRVRF